MPYNGSLSISAEHDYRQLALRLTIQVTIDLFDAVGNATKFKRRKMLI